MLNLLFYYDMDNKAKKRLINVLEIIKYIKM